MTSENVSIGARYVDAFGDTVSVVALGAHGKAQVVRMLDGIDYECNPALLKPFKGVKVEERNNE